MKLVINMNSNICYIYHYNSKNSPTLTLLKEMAHPQSKLKNSEIAMDKPGHYNTRESARGAYSPHMEPKEIEIDNFSREVAKELNQERIKKDYDELIIISPPHVNGLLFKHINNNVKNIIINRIEKDLIQLSEHELLDFLRTHAQFPDQ
ncbi:MAG: host attachment protein [Gammaproteobacteria bacterium]